MVTAWAVCFRLLTWKEKLISSFFPGMGKCFHSLEKLLLMILDMNKPEWYELHCKTDLSKIISLNCEIFQSSLWFNRQHTHPPTYLVRRAFLGPLWFSWLEWEYIISPEIGNSSFLSIQTEVFAFSMAKLEPESSHTKEIVCFCVQVTFWFTFWLNVFSRNLFRLLQH